MDRFGFPLILAQSQSLAAEEAAEEAAVVDQLAQSEMGQAAMSVWGKMAAGDFEQITTGELVALLFPIVQALVLLIIVLLVARWAKGLVVRGARKARVELTLAKFFGNIAKWSVLILGALTIFRTFGVEVTSFTAVLAGLTVGIGLALSGTLGNIAAGVMLLVFRPFKVGDVVKIADVFGKVDEIELFTTTVDTFDNRRIIVPNNQIIGAVIENLSYHTLRRADIGVGVSYAADIDKTRATLEQAVRSVETVLADPPFQIFLGDLGDNAVQWTVRAWTSADQLWPTREALTRAIKMHLDQAGLGIPFPQRDIHLDETVIEALRARG